MIWFFMAGFISGAVGMILAARLWVERRYEKHVIRYDPESGKVESAHKPTDEEMAIMGLLLDLYEKEKKKANSEEETEDGQDD